MDQTQLTLAPFVPDVRALGAKDLGDLLGTTGSLEGESRSEPVSEDDEAVLLRCPLPGTADQPGAPFVGRPRGVGTGWVFVRRYHAAGLREWLRARFTRPRSTSLAAREWNLLCHLRASGVVTPEPMAVGSEGSGLFSKRSVLVTRELDATVPATFWFARASDPDERWRAARALGLTLRRILAAGVELPRLRAEHVRIAPGDDKRVPDLAEDACGVERVLAARKGTVAPDELSHLRWRSLPEVAITSVRGGRLRPALDAEGHVAVIEGFARDPAWIEALSRRERLRVYLVATRGQLDRGTRRSALALLRRT